MTLAHLSVVSALLSVSSFMMVPRTCNASSLVFNDATWGNPSI